MDLFDLFGGITEKVDGQVEKPAPKKAGTKKTASPKNTAKRNPANRVKFTYPVTVVGRNFKVEIPGEGEVSLQGVAERVYGSGYKEVAHERVRFIKLNDNLLMLDYQCLRQSSQDIALILPVTIADGMLSAVMEKEEKTGADIEELTVQDMMKMGLADELYRGIPYDYDATSGTALPVFSCQDLKAGSINAGERIHCFGNVETVADPAGVVDQMMGELPEGVTVVCYTGHGGRILYYKAVSAAVGTVKLEKIDRSPFQVDESKVAKVVEEKIILPVTVYFINFARNYTVTAQDLNGKEKVIWEELFSYIKSVEPLFAQTDRKTDHLYDRDKGMVSVALFSGRKGCGHPIYEIEDGFTMSQKIPQNIMDEVVSYFAQDLSREAIIQIWSRDGEYYVVYPDFQDSTRSSVEYRFPIYSEGVYVMTIHSHNTMRPVPSLTDDRDELQLPGLYGIIGSIEKRGDNLYYESYFRVVRFGKEPVAVDEDEIFERSRVVCA